MHNIIVVINFYCLSYIGKKIKPSTVPTVVTSTDTTIKPSIVPTVKPGKCVPQIINKLFQMFILGSCVALNLGYSGCCKLSLTPNCCNKECYCDEHCHKLNDCCSDIADIGCHAIPSFSPTPSSIDIPGKTN